MRKGYQTIRCASWVYSSLMSRGRDLRGLIVGFSLSVWLEMWERIRSVKSFVLSMASKVVRLDDDAVDRLWSLGKGSVRTQLKMGLQIDERVTTDDR